MQSSGWLKLLRTAHALIHGEAEQKRKAGDRWDRVEGPTRKPYPRQSALSRMGLQPLVLAAPTLTRRLSQTKCPFTDYRAELEAANDDMSNVGTPWFLLWFSHNISSP